MGFKKIHRQLICDYRPIHRCIIMAEGGIHEISKISFGILTSEEIKNVAVVNVHNNKLCLEDGTGTIYDPRMGPTRGTCVQCGLDVSKCCGHMGYIDLSRPVINPIYMQHVLLLLKCVCYSCHTFILNRDHMELKGLLSYHGKRRFLELVESFKRLVLCVHCQKTQPDYKVMTIDSHASIYSFSETDRRRVLIEPEECLKRFENISDDQVSLMGFDPSLVHPKSFIMTRFPVIPTCCRPPIINEGQCCDDDLTFQQMEIIKNNAMVASTGQEKYYNNLVFRISTYFNNTSKKAKHATTGRPIKGIKERIGGKDGYIRNNLLGKRVNQSARTVIGPDPSIDMDTLIVPLIMAKILTIPEHVYSANLPVVRQWLREGILNYIVKPDGRKVIVTPRYHLVHHGDVIVTPDGRRHTVMDTRVIYPEGSLLQVDAATTRPLEMSAETPIEIGDIVYRQLRDGDYVMLNRQPTLHKASMMAMRCKILDIKTLKINLAISKPFNCDFDGDEMNIHVPQSLEARMELQSLSRPSQCLISNQASKPNMCIVQDALSAAYLITKHRDRPLERGRFFQIMMRAQGARYTLKPVYRFIDIIDALLPRQLNVTTDDLSIVDGHLMSGVLNKKYLGSTNSSLIKLLNFNYGSAVCVHFINNIQYVCNEWLLYYGLTVHAEDCLRSSGGDGSQFIEQCLKDAELCCITYRHPLIREQKIIDCLSKAKDIGMKIAKENLKPTNNFLTTVESGSKGDYFNIAQITGLLGQQTINNDRVHGTMNNGTRTLPHFPLGHKLTVSDEYKSKGFIRHSFESGLDPLEFFYHSISGRKGVSDTALSTATSGYIMRRIVKLTEDCIVQYDGTIRDAGKRLYQYCYNGNGYDPTKLYNGQICNVKNFANNKHANSPAKNIETFQPKTVVEQPVVEKTVVEQTTFRRVV